MCSSKTDKIVNLSSCLDNILSWSLQFYVVLKHLK